METKEHIFKTLTDLSICTVCATRLIGEADLSAFDSFFQDLDADDDKATRKHTKCNPCIACLGFFRHALCKETVNKVISYILNSGHDCDNFNISLTVPFTFQVRAYSLSIFMRTKWPAFCSTYSSSEYWPSTSIKDVWKHILSTKIESKLKKKFNALSEMDISISYKYDDDGKECKFLCDLFPKLRKNNEISRTYLETILRGTYSQWHFEKYFSSPPPLPSKFVEFLDVSMHHASIYCGGRYNKWTRTLSQTPWIINGQRRFETSVEELITEDIKKAFKAVDTCFGSSGREDVDVRTLGRGRPFYVELINPGLTKLSKEDLQKVERSINTHGYKQIKVSHLQIIDKSLLRLIKEGEDSKQKKYCAYCVVWGPMPDLSILNHCAPFDIIQKTPLRVLHRRPLIDRKRTIHELSASPTKFGPPDGPSFFKILVTTQAGTYIKEFVHSDFGRTKPNLGSLLGNIKVSILALDVLDIYLDWPPNSHNSIV